FCAKGGLFQQQGDVWKRWTADDGLASLGVVGIVEDNEGNIYFDTSEGVSKYDGVSFSTLPLAQENSGGGNWVLEEGDLWFRMGWDHSGPFRYDGVELHYLEFPKTAQEEAFRELYPNVGYSPYGVYTIYRAEDGAVWFGTSSLGLCRFDGETVDWMYEDYLTNTPGGGAFGIRSILESEDGTFWICTPEYAYEIADEGVGGELRYQKLPGLDGVVMNETGEIPYLMSMVKDNQGGTWMASYTEGVWHINGETCHRYEVNTGEEAAEVFSITCDLEGTIWLGTHNGGAYRLVNGRFEPFTPAIAL
ncbi:MAG: hypothetical protein KDC12_11645, partial [Flavobacteriales bacterium]|nr:hypothetical protein [Flavobacteriales bacterium]